MTRVAVLIVSGLMIACTSVFGQTSSSDANATPSPTTATSQSPDEHGRYVSGFEILNGDRNGKDLESYPNQVLAKVRQKWYPQILELQKSLGRKRGIAVIDFEISSDGSATKVTTAESTGDASLDAAASLAILRSAPFAHLPDAYHEKALKLRMHFGYYQPGSAEAPFCDGPNWGAHPAAYPLHEFREGLTPPKEKYYHEPEYSKQARKDKYMSTVWIAGTVDPQGNFADLCVSQSAGEGLDETAMEAVRTWTFEPATLRGEPVAVRINVEVSYHLY